MTDHDAFLEEVKRSTLFTFNRADFGLTGKPDVPLE